MLTVFFFAPLWRRARVLTDMEFAEFRYSGPPATFLRGFRAAYLAFPVNTIIMGWVRPGAWPRSPGADPGADHSAPAAYRGLLLSGADAGV